MYFFTRPGNTFISTLKLKECQKSTEKNSLNFAEEELHISVNASILLNIISEQTNNIFSKNDIGDCLLSLFTTKLGIKMLQLKSQFVNRFHNCVLIAIVLESKSMLTGEVC